MNFKTFTALAFASASLAAFSAVTAQNKMCRIALSTDTKDTLIAVPLTAPGGAAIKVTDFVLTTGLPENTKLQYKDGSVWRAWLLQSGAWTAAAGDAAPSNDITFDRGKAVLLSLPEAPASAATIYLFGEYASTEAVQTPVAGSSNAAAFTLLGNAKPESFEINKSGFWTASGSPSAGDKIIVPAAATETTSDMKEFVWNGGAWKVETRTVKTVGKIKVTSTSYETVEYTLDPGQGFWYVSTSSTVPTVTW